MKSLKLLLISSISLPLLLSGSLWAQDDSLPFDELEAELENSETPQAQVPEDSGLRETLEKEKSADSQAETGIPNEDETDETLEETFEGDLQLADPEELEGVPEAPEELQNPPPPETKLAEPKKKSAPIPQVVNPKTEEKMDLPPALRDDELELALESDEDPSDLFAKIPLRDPLSETNWRKFAGSAIEKNYRIRKKDTLWAISERFFGNPYLWPKVWQLNATLGNPHEIDPKMEIAFEPGQLNSAPSLALRIEESDAGPIYLVENDVPLSLVEKLEKLLAYQNTFPHPAFQTFVLENEPLIAARIPEQAIEREATFYSENDTFKVKDLAPGTYSIVDLKPLRTDRRSQKSGNKGYIVKWFGVAKVGEDQVARIQKAFAEIEKDFVLISENFWIRPMQLRFESLGEQKEVKNSIVPIQDGTLGGASAYQLLGVNFGNDEGPTPGALVTLRNRYEKIGTALVLHRQGRFGTMTVVESKKEITATDYIE